MACGIGIDVCKQWLDVAVHGGDRPERFDNNARGLRRLVARFRATPCRQVVLEATGGYERAALEALHAAGLPVVRINPRQARDFAKATGQLAKTDALDARVLAQMAALLDLPRYQPPEPWQQQLAQYQQRRGHLVQALQQERQRLEGLDDPWLRSQLKATLAHLQRSLKSLDARIAGQVAAQPQLAALQQVKGVGPVLVATLAGHLPELGQIDGKAIAKLVGVAPLACDSGSWQGTRHVWGGRAVVRTVLYMATLSAIRYEPRLRDFYQSLRARGKPAKVAIVASMRKLLVILNARIRDHRAATALA
ncbi:transposase [Lysobacter sp. GX 14042]|uniref:IS110 family transposase n=1 Tax=Lysobacter sp. GX 14042 TaxID=2907155 RepID=UPI001F45CEDF|nr:transposase [Lysobacter sp. GX 14042]MCE7033579.1 transposase [Lysobacter sp. GX 14042]